jgi:hypothetical protein
MAFVCAPNYPHVVLVLQVVFGVPSSIEQRLLVMKCHEVLRVSEAQTGQNLGYSTHHTSQD